MSPAALLTQNPSFPPSFSQCARTQSMERRSTVLSSIKGRFSRKGAELPSSNATPTSPPASPRRRAAENRPSDISPPTRRPNRPGMNAFTVASNEPPPAYSPRGADHQTTATPPAARGAAAAAAAATTTAGANDEDSAYSFLSTFDTIFLIDDSGSMAGRSWRETSQALETITPICTKHDSDGIDIYFLNAAASPHFHNISLPSTVHEIFSTVRPSGGTPTGQRLNEILRPYIAALERDPQNTKPINIIVITDGVPSDDVESVIIRAAKKLDKLDAEPWQVGIQFFQVGEEEGAADHLAGLDDELSRMGDGCRDIVDTVPFVRGPNNRGVGLTGEAILKVVLGAVNKRLDRRTNRTTPTTA